MELERTGWNLTLQFSLPSHKQIHNSWWQNRLALQFLYFRSFLRSCYEQKIIEGFTAIRQTCMQAKDGERYWWEKKNDVNKERNHTTRSLILFPFRVPIYTQTSHESKGLPDCCKSFDYLLFVAWPEKWAKVQEL
jgi:hypothetical protein